MLYVRSHINVACSHLHFMKVIINVPVIGLSGHCFTARSVRQYALIHNGQGGVFQGL